MADARNATIFAYTAGGPPYPPYVNLSELPAGKGFKLLVRSEPAAGGLECGATAAIDLSMGMLVQLHEAISKRIKEGSPHSRVNVVKAPEGVEFDVRVFAATDEGDTGEFVIPGLTEIADDIQIDRLINTARDADALPWRVATRDEIAAVKAQRDAPRPPTPQPEPQPQRRARHEIPDAEEGEAD